MPRGRSSRPRLVPRAQDLAGQDGRRVHDLLLEQGVVRQAVREARMLGELRLHRLLPEPEGGRPDEHR